MSKKKKAQQNYYQSNQTRMLRCNLRDNSIDVKPEWELIQEFTKQTFDRIGTCKPVFIGTERECGELYAYDATWDKCSSKRPKHLNTFSGKTFEESIFDDPVMVELIEQDKADVFTTDVIASILMSATKANYSWDVEIKRFGEKIFIDKRAIDEDEEIKPENILDFDTVNETAIDKQPLDD